MEINLSRVFKLYPKVISIEEYYHPVNKWTSILPDGRDVRSEELYRGTPPLTGGGSLDPIREKVVKLCIKAGATHVQFKCRDSNNELCFPDYKVEELIWNDPIESSDDPRKMGLNNGG